MADKEKRAPRPAPRAPGNRPPVPVVPRKVINPRGHKKK